jgi:LmbE family N-acetylglucosaminyl deacetylase
LRSEPERGWSLADHDLGRVVVISPHCDDAVFGAGDLIAARPGTVVVTVFTAGPRVPWLRPWDRDCGFEDGDDVMHVRREEDLAALTLLGGRPVWLPFRDDQYGRDAETNEIAPALADAITGAAAATVVMPLGLFHRDHTLANDAAVAVRRQCPSLTWMAYEDAIYRRLEGEPVRMRISALREAGVVLEPLAVDRGPASPLKRRAVDCYASQLRGLSRAGRVGYSDVFEPEGYWRLA